MEPAGFAVVAVNWGDPAQAIKDFRKQVHFTFQVVMDKVDSSGKASVATQYQVPGTPANYLLNPKGQLVGFFQGFDEPSIRETLHGMGVG